MKFRLLLLSALLLSAESKHITTKVAILGAGASGISAAKLLSKAGMHDYIIVDAQSFIGGRVQHEAFGNSYVELGANWIYGKGDNPIHRMAMQHGLKTTPNDKNNVAYFDDSGLLKDQQEGINVSNEFESVKVKLVDYADKRMKRQQVDLSSRSALSLLGWKPNTPLKAAVEYFNIDWEFSEPAEMCSLDYATGTVDSVTGTYPFGNEFVVDERGFNYVLKKELATFLHTDDARLMLNTLVTEVIYNDQNVTVITSNGHVIEAEYAICTFSLGVLQSDLVRFTPMFPEWKRESLLSFHMTTYTKIFLRFKKRFWGDWQFALYANNVTQHGGYYTVWQNLNAPGYLFKPAATGDNILMVTTTDTESQRIERMTNTQVQHEIMLVLQKMFPSVQVEPPIDILIPRWHQHPLFRGSYSNWPIGALKKHHLNMRAPLENRLWFAGEATSSATYGFVHSAWLEGESVAKSILQCITTHCPVYEKHEYITGCDVNVREKPRFFGQFSH
ncbi:NifU-like protein 5, mitochondrial [Mucor velutinosus]|uniref:NifU-like protein 5, mitochondrial n=1 Tax=Mucor velutinosus TaxID=708070 RepID=A0AAN7D852_9FUNG|nr:NifU-like protein 5, mitochondrial [Mucor velutinosus]